MALMNPQKRLTLEVEILEFLSRFAGGLTASEIVRAFPHSRAGQVIEHLVMTRAQIEEKGGKLFVTEFGRSRVVGRPLKKAVTS